MEVTRRSSEVELVLHPAIKRLLVVGPKPPPLGGSPMTVQAIADELAGHPSIRIALIDTSPYSDPMKRMTGSSLERARRMISIIGAYICEIRSADAVLMFANNLFALTVVPVALLIARCFHKRFYIKPVGGDLDLYIKTQNKVVHEYLLSVLRAADGVLAQTQLLQASLTALGCTSVHYVPGLRPAVEPDIARSVDRDRDGEGVRLVFLALIHRDKGPLVLLEALQLLAGRGSTTVSCDFYGPIHDQVREEFLHLLAKTPNARYCGVAEAGSGPRVIAAYDALVLPTCFACEGHPGVIIEAMQVGVPVISTQHRAIPELVTHGDNGLLVPVRDSQALAEAIEQIAVDRPLRQRLGQASRRRGSEFTAEVVVPRMLEVIFPQ